MKKLAILSTLLAVCFVIAALAQTSAPKPDPALQKLQVLVGHWTFDGEYKAGSWGPGGKIKGEYTAQFILKGFALEAHTVERAAEMQKSAAKKTAEARFLEIDAYDPATKSITFTVWSDANTTYSGVLTVAGNTISWEGKVAAAGKEYRVKEPLVFSDDRMTATTKAEISTDGKTWQPYFEGKYTKAKPAAKN